jgi:hypothetical protein
MLKIKTMKRATVLLTIFVLSTMSCKAQHIIPIEDTYKYKGTEGGLLGDYDYVYVKDVNNHLTKFIGAWKGNYDDKNYEVRIIKRTTDDPEVKKDELLMRYKITDSNGTVIENTLSLPNDSNFVLTNGYVDRDGGYVFSYIGRDIACGQNGWVFTQVYGDTKQKMQLFLSVEGEMYPECVTGEAKQILPVHAMILIKQ